jgi:hypothetical protein
MSGKYDNKGSKNKTATEIETFPGIAPRCQCGKNAIPVEEDNCLKCGRKLPYAN